MDSIINISSISKKYDTLDLNDVTFKVYQGDIIAVLGANGSGKTTLLQMLSTSIKPDNGTLVYNSPNENKTISDIRQDLGVLFETPALYGCMTIYENLDFVADLYNIRQKQKRQLIKIALDLAGLADRKNSLIDTLSYGLKRRADIARVFITDPEILILDEPFKGLDTKTITQLKQKLKEYSSAGKTIIFSTNNHVDAYDLATNAVFLHKNQFYFDTIKKIQIKLLSKNG